MSTRIRQSTPIPTGSDVKVNNNFPRKRIRMKNIPLGSTIRVDKSFVKPERLEVKMSKIKASSAFKNGKSKARAQLKRIKSTSLRKGDVVKINVSTS